MSSISQKVIVLYTSTLLGASLSEIEVCRIGLWNCLPFRGAWVTQITAVPMLMILIFTRMAKKLLSIASSIISIFLYLFGLQAARSPGSLTWPAYNVYIFFFGVGTAIVIWVFSDLRYDRPIPPPPLPAQLVSDNLYKNAKLMSLKYKIVSLYIGALVGGIIGQIFIYGSVIDDSTFTYQKISFEDVPFLLIRIVAGSATPIVILFSQLSMVKVKTIQVSFLMAIIVLGLSLFYGQFDSLSGYNSLGYHSLWFAGILAAFMTVTVQKRRIRGQTFSNLA